MRRRERRASRGRASRDARARERALAAALAGLGAQADRLEREGQLLGRHRRVRARELRPPALQARALARHHAADADQRLPSDADAAGAGQAADADPHTAAAAKPRRRLDALGTVAPVLLGG